MLSKIESVLALAGTAATLCQLFLPPLSQAQFFKPLECQIERSDSSTHINRPIIPLQESKQKAAEARLRNILHPKFFALAVPRRQSFHSLNAAIAEHSALHGHSNYSNKEVPVDYPEIGDLELMSKYEIVFLLDRSGSMNELVGPAESGATSRFQWIGKQLENFATQTSPSVPEGFSVIPFGKGTRMQHCNRRRFLEFFRNEIPDSDSQIVPALHDAFSKRETPLKPLAIVIITDGKLDDAEMAREEIIQEARIEKNRLRLLCLTVGDSVKDSQEKPCLEGLPSVTIVSFHKLLTDGVPHSIERFLEEHAATWKADALGAPAPSRHCAN